MNIIVCPGCAKSINDAKTLFGESRVTTGFFREPIGIANLSDEEATFAKEYFEEQGKKVILEA